MELVFSKSGQLELEPARYTCVTIRILWATTTSDPSVQERKRPLDNDNTGPTLGQLQYQTCGQLQYQTLEDQYHGQFHVDKYTNTLLTNKTSDSFGPVTCAVTHGQMRKKNSVDIHNIKPM